MSIYKKIKLLEDTLTSEKIKYNKSHGPTYIDNLHIINIEILIEENVLIFNKVLIYLIDKLMNTDNKYKKISTVYYNINIKTDPKKIIFTFRYYTQR